MSLFAVFSSWCPESSSRCTLPYRSGAPVATWGQTSSEGGGDSPLAPTGLPHPGGTPGPPRGNRGAPPRGVDVKETPRRAQKGPKRPFPGEYRQKGGFSPKSPKTAFFRHFQDFYPGSYRAKKAPKPHFWGKSSKRGRKSRVREVPGGGFTSTPRAGAPRFPGGRKGGISGYPRRGGFPGSPGVLSGTPGGASGAPGPRGPLAGTAGPRREGLM